MTEPNPTEVVAKKLLDAAQKNVIKEVLQRAIKGWKPDVIIQCLDMGADAQPLLTAAIERKDFNLVKLSFEKGATVQRYDGHILHHAYTHFDPDIIKHLCSLGVSVNQTDADGKTIAEKALEEGKTSKLVELLNLGADMKKQAEEIFSLGVKDRNIAAMTWARQQGVDVNAAIVPGANNIRTSALQYLCAESYCTTSAFDFLRNAGADPDNHLPDEKPPMITVLTRLMDRFSDKHEKFIKKLLEMGVNVNAANQGGETALLIAAMNNEDDLCELLLSKGADPLIVSKRGKTVFDYANDKLLPILMNRVQELYVARMGAEDLDLTTESALRSLSPIRFEANDKMKRTEKGEEQAPAKTAGAKPQL